MTTNRIRETNRWITIDGERKLLVEWAAEYGVSPQLILGRLRAGWDEETAVTKPVRKYGDQTSGKDSLGGSSARDAP
jgi:hypothetical protein